MPVLLEGLATKYPDISKEIAKYVAALIESKQNFLGIEIRKLAPNHQYINIKCTSVDPLLNKKLVEQIARMKIVPGFFRRSSNHQES